VPLPAAPTPEPVDEDPAAAGRVRGIVALSVGVAALLTGTATGYFSAIKTFNEQPRCSQGHCPLDSQSTLATANTLANVSNVSFAVAGVAAVYGLYELLTLPKRAPVARRARVGLTASGLSLEGRF
jgi:hypothetical protein